MQNQKVLKGNKMTDTCRLNYIETRNFMGIKEVRFRPEGNVVRVIGQNGQGKSSLIKAVEVGMRDKSAAPDKPIRDGESEAEIILDIGTFNISRRFTESGMVLKVRDQNDQPVPAPQKVLDELIGAVAFDPQEFAAKKPEEQAKMIAAALGIDFTGINEKYKIEYDMRSVANRDVKRLEATVNEKRRAVQGMKASDFKSRIVIDDVLAEQAEARVKHEKTEYLARDQANLRSSIEKQKIKIADLEIELSNAKSLLSSSEKDYKMNTPVLAAMNEQLPDLSQFDEKIRTAGTHNETVAKFESLRKEEDELALARETAKTHDKTCDDILEEKARMVAGADLPVEGMKFDEDGIEINGIPLKQCSSAEQLKVAVGLAMKLNPKLRVLRIMNGSLLDKSSLDIVEGMATENDFQVFIEIVGDSAEGSDILIEDGRIVE